MELQSQTRQIPFFHGLTVCRGDSRRFVTIANAPNPLFHLHFSGVSHSCAVWALQSQTRQIPFSTLHIYICGKYHKEVTIANAPNPLFHRQEVEIVPRMNILLQSQTRQIPFSTVRRLCAGGLYRCVTIANAPNPLFHHSNNALFDIRSVGYNRKRAKSPFPP